MSCRVLKRMLKPSELIAHRTQPSNEKTRKKKIQIIYSAINTYADSSATDKFLFMIKPNSERCAHLFNI